MIKNRSTHLNRSTIVSKIKAATSVTAFFIPALVLSISTSVIAESTSISLEQRIRHLEELNQTRNKVQADLSYQLSELQREIRSLTGQVEENNFKLKQIQDRQRDLYRDIENRLSGLNGSSVNNQSTASQNNNSSGGLATNAPTNTRPSVVSDTSGKARREFETAFALVRNKDYTAAITAFDVFLTKYPNSSFSANARYWMGQVYLVQGNSTDAAKQFTSLISEFPTSGKNDAAKLKLAGIFFKQENWSKAKNYYSEVAKNTSGTQQQLARKGLDKIKQAGH